jgi:TatD DNase family protein
MIITGGSLPESKAALKLARDYGEYLVQVFATVLVLFLGSWADLFATVGCHPTRSAEFDQFWGGPEAYLKALDELVASNLEGKGRAVAIGECGLGIFRRCFLNFET